MTEYFQRIKQSKKSQLLSALPIILIGIVTAATVIASVGVSLGITADSPDIVQNNSNTTTTTAAPPQATMLLGFNTTLRLINVGPEDFTSPLSNDNVMALVNRELLKKRVIQGVNWDDGPFFMDVRNRQPLDSSDTFGLLTYYQPTQCTDSADVCLQRRNDFISQNFGSPFPFAMCVGALNVTGEIALLPSLTLGESFEENLQQILPSANHYYSVNLVYSGSITLRSSATALNVDRISTAICGVFAGTAMPDPSFQYISVSNPPGGSTGNFPITVYYVGNGSCLSSCRMNRENYLASVLKGTTITYLDDLNGDTFKEEVLVEDIMLLTNGSFDSFYHCDNSSAFDEAVKKRRTCTMQYSGFRNVSTDITNNDLNFINKLNGEIAVFIEVQREGGADWTYGPEYILFSESSTPADGVVATLTYDFANAEDPLVNQSRIDFVENKFTDITLGFDNPGQNTISIFAPQPDDYGLVSEVEFRDGTEIVESSTPKYYIEYTGTLFAHVFTEAECEAAFPTDNEINEGIKLVAEKRAGNDANSNNPMCFRVNYPLNEVNTTLRNASVLMVYKPCAGGPFGCFQERLANFLSGFENIQVQSNNCAVRVILSLKFNEGKPVNVRPGLTTGGFNCIEAFINEEDNNM